VNQQAQKFRYLPGLALAAVVLVLLGGSGWLISGWIGKAAPASKPVAQEIRIIRPPPPPPEVEEPPPPPEEVDIPEPEEMPDPTPSDDPPPGDLLGLDAEGTAGGDGFGLAARKGGRDLLASGGSAFTWYAGLLKDEILQQLGDAARARSGSYSVLIRVWVAPDGAIERVVLAQSSGDVERDRAIESALARINRIAQSPPAGMPQPINLRIVSRA
jgi:protein TonB